MAICSKERLEKEAGKMISILFVFLHSLLSLWLNYCKELYPLLQKDFHVIHCMAE